MHSTAHKARMEAKALHRAEIYKWPSHFGITIRSVTPASVNYRTGKPHEHKREIARRARQQGKAA